MVVPPCEHTGLALRRDKWHGTGSPCQLLTVSGPELRAEDKADKCPAPPQAAAHNSVASPHQQFHAAKTGSLSTSQGPRGCSQPHTLHASWQQRAHQVQSWELIPGAMSQAGSAHHDTPWNKGCASRGRALHSAREVPTSAPSSSYLSGIIGQSEDLWDKAGSLARAMCTPGRRFLCESPEEFSCLQPVGTDSRGSKEELSSSSPIISLACWCDFPGPFFLSVSTVTWAAGNSPEFPTIV